MTRSFLSQKTVDFSMGDIMNDRIYRMNLLIIVFSWIASSFCFYIVGFYIKYIPGSVFSNVVVTSIADGLSSITAGIIAQYVGTQKALCMSYSLAFVGGFLLIASGKDEILIMICVLITKFGINSAFTLCYIINTEYFPSIVCSRIFGICNIFARISTIMSPLIAEITPPIPMLIYCLICALSSIASMFLTKNKDAEEAIQDLDDSFSSHSDYRFGLQNRQESFASNT